MKIHNRLLAAITCLIVLIPISSAGAAEDPIAAAGAFQFPEGTFAPPFALADLIGNQVALADFRGKVALINFWATW